MLDENTVTPGPVLEALPQEVPTETSEPHPAPPSPGIMLAPGIFATVADCIRAAHDVRPKHSGCGGKGWRRRAGQKVLCDCGIDRLKAKVARAMASPLEQDRKNTPIVSAEERDRESARRKVRGWQAEVAELRGKMQERAMRNAEMVAALEWQARGADTAATDADRNADVCKAGITAREIEIRSLEQAILTARAEIAGLAKDREKFAASAAEHRKQAEHHRAQVDPTKRKLPKSNEGALERIRALEAQVGLKLARFPELRNGSAPLPALAVDEAMAPRVEASS